MLMKVCFEYIDEAHCESGLFLVEVCEYLGISVRTWYRWRERKKGPKWALVALEALAGRLDHLGWKGFYISNGYMYNRDLSPKYYQFEPGHLIGAVFCSCPAHRNIRRSEQDKTKEKGYICESIQDHFKRQRIQRLRDKGIIAN